MATPYPIIINVKYTDRLKQWQDAIFHVPLENIVDGRSRECGIPIVSDEVIVSKKSKSGRIRKWKGLVVLEEEAKNARELVDESLGDSAPDSPEPVPPGCGPTRQKRLLLKGSTAGGVPQPKANKNIIEK